MTSVESATKIACTALIELMESAGNIAIRYVHQLYLAVLMVMDNPNEAAQQLTELYLSNVRLLYELGLAVFKITGILIDVISAAANAGWPVLLPVLVMLVIVAQSVISAVKLVTTIINFFVKLIKTMLRL